ncbi:MAG TPA: hypothetical protein VD967_00515 [Candidatus Paceibacterota bacterium]|nr:hypothetical protein [Candidatus Paceibacterota bacterium]
MFSPVVGIVVSIALAVCPIVMVGRRWQALLVQPLEIKVAIILATVGIVLCGLLGLWYFWKKEREQEVSRQQAASD